jgi:hypothetical protein
LIHTGPHQAFQPWVFGKEPTQPPIQHFVNKAVVQIAISARFSGWFQQNVMGPKQRKSQFEDLAADSREGPQQAVLQHTVRGG